MFPGIAYIFFPCSKAKSTVISVPLFCFASTTNAPVEIPLIIRFLAGNVYLLGLVPAGYSDINKPLFFITSFSNNLFSGG